MTATNRSEPRMSDLEKVLSSAAESFDSMVLLLLEEVTKRPSEEIAYDLELAIYNFDQLYAKVLAKARR